MKKEKLRKNKGITLIALVITIIVLLILAAVTINLTLGERGIFSIAQQAAKNYTNSQNRELANLDHFELELEDTLNGVSEAAYNEEKKVNEPQTAGTGLTPVTISTDGTITPVEDTSNDWYSYDGSTNIWANAKSKGTTNEYDSYWVWIPRFAYKIDYTEDEDKSKGGTIDIVFLKGTTDRPAPKTANGVDSANITIKRASEVGDTDGDSVYIVHPAFTNESSIDFANGGWDREIPGFWIAKFEAGYVGNFNNEGNIAKESPVIYSTISTSSFVEAGQIKELKEVYSGEREAGSRDYVAYIPAIETEF